ncbi:hypothetical protein [Enterococcus olivae]
MALKINKSTTLTGQSMVGGNQAVYFRAEIMIGEGQNTNANQSITNQELYDANKTECRNDWREFQDKIWDIEDQLIAEADEEE